MSPASMVPLLSLGQCGGANLLPPTSSPPLKRALATRLYWFRPANSFPLSASLKWSFLLSTSTLVATSISQNEFALLSSIPPPFTLVVLPWINGALSFGPGEGGGWMFPTLVCASVLSSSKEETLICTCSLAGCFGFGSGML